MSKKYFYWLVYLITFIAVFSLVFVCFFQGNYSFVNRVDGLNQQYSSFLYFYRWGNEIIEKFRITNKLEIPMWDINIGYGSDLLTTIFYYVNISPITLAALFFPESYLEYFYMLEFFMRLFLAGLGFSAYAKSHNNKNWAVLLGSMSYCFCGFVLQKGVQHTFFVTAMFFLPLIFIGIDRVLKRQSPFLFILFTALAAISGFYFFYMIVLAAILYVACQLIFNDTFSWKEKFVWIGKFFLYGLVAVLIAGIVLFPTIFGMMGSERLGNDKYVPIFYSLSYYFQLLCGSGTNEFRDFDTRTGYAIPTLFTIVVLWCEKGEKKLKAAFIGLTLCLCLPVAGSVFNGMGYVSNRWIFIYSFLLSYILTKMLPHCLEFNYKKTVKLLIALSVGGGIEILALLAGISESIDIYRSSCYLILFIIGLVVLSYYKAPEKVIKCWIAIGVIGSILFNSWEEFSPLRTSAVNGYVKRGDVLSEYEVLPSDILKDVMNEENYRGEVDSIGREHNNSFMIQGIHGVEYYFSMVNNSVNELQREMYYNKALEHQYKGIGDELILESLTGLKYILSSTQKNNQKTVAYELISSENEMQLWKNSYALPIAYCYENYISREEYDKLDVADKQEALLYGAVTEESKLSEVTPQFSNYEIPFTIEGEYTSESECITFKNVDNTSISLNLELFPKDVELYVVVEGISYQGVSPMERYIEQWEETDWWTQTVVKDADKKYQEPSNVSMYIQMGDYSGTINYVTPKDRMYCGRNNFLCNLGYIQQGTDEIVLTFSDYGIYSFSDIKVIAQPVEPVLQQLEILQNGDVPEWYFGTNSMYGVVTCKQDEILCITVPFSAGWSAYVDGQEQPIKQINTAFMGIELSEGKHDIRFVYKIPFMQVGGCATIIGMVALGVITLYFRKKRNSNKKDEFV